MLVYYFVPFIVSNRYLLFWVSNGLNSAIVQNRTHVYMNFFHHKDLGNHLLQLCPKVVKHPVYLYSPSGPLWPVLGWPLHFLLLYGPNLLYVMQMNFCPLLFRFCKTELQSRESRPFPCLWMLRNDVTLIEFCSRCCLSNLAECMACNVAVPWTADDWLTVVLSATACRVTSV